MPTLPLGSLDFARLHIERYYDSDFFPKPVAYDAIWSAWGEVSEFLAQVELAQYQPRSPRIGAAPKASGDFRIVHQLEPLDALIYTALAHVVAERVEAARMTLDCRTVFSYRIAMDSGSFFGGEMGYRQFLGRAQELAAGNGWVLVTDITDFYNQIYLHRLENAIAAALPDGEPWARPIADFLSRLNTGVSKGLPVGPAASIVFAEASMVDVDQFIANSGLTHVRYVDDIRVFAPDRHTLLGLLERMSKYLYENHRLTLSSAKTKVISSDAFVRQYLESPEQKARTRLHAELAQFQCEGDYGQVTTPDREDLPPRVRLGVDVAVIRGLLDQVLAGEVLDLGLARHALRRARDTRVRAIARDVMTRIDFLSPVIPDVALYLRASATGEFLHNNCDAVEAMVSSDACQQIPLVRLWLGWLLAGYPCLASSRTVSDFLRSCPISIQADWAVSRRDIAWFRDSRGGIGQYGSWDRQAMLHASRVLGRDERLHWLRSVQGRSPDPVDQYVIRWMLAQ